MADGAITEYIDVAQLVLYVFWGFFAYLIFYLRREDKREGYPLESDRSSRIEVVGWPSLPDPKVYKLAGGGTVVTPRKDPPQPEVAARPSALFPGAPLEPTGDAMRDGVGAAAYADRHDHPELTLHGEPRIVPMRVATDFSVEPRDPDPRGMNVVCADGVVGGTVSDIWVDRSEPQVRYLEIELGGGVPAGAVAGAADEDEPGEEESPEEAGGEEASAGEATPEEARPEPQRAEEPPRPAPPPVAEPPRPRRVAPPPRAGGRRVLVPITLAGVDGRRRRVNVASILAGQLAHVPVLRNPDQVTSLEEDRICAYYGGGHLHAEPSRQEPLL